jgi:NADH dehydrogenase [ubiquinone] 1 alpha subcomplex assembly factor 1
MAVGMTARLRRHEASIVGAVDAFALGATLSPMQPAHAGSPLPDFTRPEVVRAFRIINDGVMGGVSASRLSPVAGAMLFEGEISLEKNGGFASFRGAVRLPAESAALLLTVRGDGQRYKLTLKLDESTGSAQYQATFVAQRAWRTLRFEPADFTASFRGRAVAAPMVRFADVRYFGLLISDRQSGPFKIELKEIGAE